MSDYVSWTSSRQTVLQGTPERELCGMQCAYANSTHLRKKVLVLH